MEENRESSSSGSSNGSGYQESSPKNKNQHQDEQESVPDRLSELPEPLLVQILSFMEMKDAVKTCVLSKMWKYLWTHVDNIVFEFDDRLQPSAKLPDFISFVHHTLMQCTHPYLKKFYLFILDDNYDHELLDEWLHCVFKKKLEFLKLNLLVDGYCFPEWFYHNSSLVKLEINMNNPWWYNGHTHTVSWTSLKSLQLTLAPISDGQIAIILSGCPVLETIVLIETFIIDSLRIESPSVKTLKLVNLEDHGIYDWLEIHAPFLKELEIVGGSFFPRCRLLNVSSMVYAKFDYTPKSNQVDCNIVWPKVAAKLLEVVNHVEELILGPVFIQTLSLLTLLGTPFPLFKCKRVKIHSTLLKYERLGIVRLLNSLPYLDTLVIDVVIPGEKYFSGFYGQILYSSGDKYLIIKKENLSNLKNLKVVHSRNMCCGVAVGNNAKKRVDFDLVVHLLGLAHALEKLVITSTAVDNCKCSRNCGSHYAFFLSDMISKYLKGNEAFKWELTRNKSYFEFTFFKS